MATMKQTRPIAPDLDTPGQDLEGLGGPAVSGPPERDVEGLGPDGDVDDLDSTHRTPPRASRLAPEMGLDPREDDDGLDTDDAFRTEAYDSGLGQDAGLEGEGSNDEMDGADTRSR